MNIPVGSTVFSLLEEIGSSDPAFREVALDGSGLKDYIQLMINKKRIDPLHASIIQLKEGDELAIFPPVSGG